MKRSRKLVGKVGDTHEIEGTEVSFERDSTSSVLIRIGGKHVVVFRTVEDDPIEIAVFEIESD